MDERGQAKCRNEEILSHIMIHGVAMHMAVNVAGNCIFRPAPFLHRHRVELQFARWRREAFVGFTINLDTNRCTITSNRAVECIYLSTLKIKGIQLALIEAENGRFVYRNFKGTI